MKSKNAETTKIKVNTFVCICSRIGLEIVHILHHLKPMARRFQVNRVTEVGAKLCKMSARLPYVLQMVALKQKCFSHNFSSSSHLQLLTFRVQVQVFDVHRPEL